MFFWEIDDIETNKSIFWRPFNTTEMQEILFWSLASKALLTHRENLKWFERQIKL